ncbi:hypothetical protein TNCT_248701 [Trichonephila clavata]|uniref:DUF4817 domain-containing protein n=1 Tax=Trichonephila clavata TaxID=2740835 RepID=A0A8X6KZH4_TRICU|nr:hypothetical protein TNCT_248701 [Trichonephila clavata]
MLSLEERISIASWKQSGKTYKKVCQLYQRKYGKQPPTRNNIRLLANKFRRTGRMADEKRPGQPSISDDTVKRLYQNCS